MVVVVYNGFCVICRAEMKFVLLSLMCITLGEYVPQSLSLFLCIHYMCHAN